ncbi:hypothetical protein Ddye_032066 [Dipteronia dyeriana]|uniref:Uncharacterized protein n=1 Tax=Dipteronia dyeriana TaxID=168575 RepID=A0AAD9WMV5_9ROSI|nr:hypothetical protein Ddye_032066 [Dipteronia dyeriana]
MNNNSFIMSSGELRRSPPVDVAFGIALASKDQLMQVLDSLQQKDKNGYFAEPVDANEVCIYWRLGWGIVMRCEAIAIKKKLAEKLFDVLGIDIKNLKPVRGKKNIEYVGEKEDDSKCSNSCSDETGNEITLKARHALYIGHIVSNKIYKNVPMSSSSPYMFNKYLCSGNKCK